MDLKFARRLFGKNRICRLVKDIILFNTNHVGMRCEKTQRLIGLAPLDKAPFGKFLMMKRSKVSTEHKSRLNAWPAQSEITMAIFTIPSLALVLLWSQPSNLAASA